MAKLITAMVSGLYLKGRHQYVSLFYYKKAKLIYDLQNLLKSFLIIPKEMVKNSQNVLADFSFTNFTAVPG